MVFLSVLRAVLNLVLHYSSYKALYGNLFGTKRDDGYKVTVSPLESAVPGYGSCPPDALHGPVEDPHKPPALGEKLRGES